MVCRDQRERRSGSIENRKIAKPDPNSFHYKIDLNDVLKTLGMGEAFDPTSANFSGMAPAPPGERLFISRVKHKTFAEVNEEGTVAAAVTSVVAQFTSAAPPREKFIMKMDRPFFVAIRDHVTGVVLFMGSVGDPQ